MNARFRKYTPLAALPGYLGRPCTLRTVPRNRILALVVVGLLLVMLGALLYEAFDFGDMQPFGVDPEVPLFMLGSLLLLCIGDVVLAVRRASDSLASAKVAPLDYPRLALRVIGRCEAFGIEHLLFPRLWRFLLSAYRQNSLAPVHSRQLACLRPPRTLAS